MRETWPFLHELWERGVAFTASLAILISLRFFFPTIQNPLLVYSMLFFASVLAILLLYLYIERHYACPITAPSILDPWRKALETLKVEAIELWSAEGAHFAFDHCTTPLFRVVTIKEDKMDLVSSNPTDAEIQFAHQILLLQKRRPILRLVLTAVLQSLVLMLLLGYDLFLPASPFLFDAYEFVSQLLGITLFLVVSLWPWRKHDQDTNVEDLYGITQEASIYRLTHGVEKKDYWDVRDERPERRA
jgi:hypothetical protein